MKIILLMATLIISGSILSQRCPTLDKIIIEINSPASIKGTYKVMGTVDSSMYASCLLGKAGNYWGIKDVTKTAVKGKFVLVNDTTGVNIINGADLKGNIAVVYYGGGIRYKQKMINIQAAGAVAMILITDKDGAESYAGGEGDAAAMEITIPMFVIQNSDGNKIVSVLKKEEVNGFVGAKPIYKNDIQLDVNKAVTPARLTNVTALVQQDDVIDSLGIVVKNNGTDVQDSVLCEVLIKYGDEILHQDFKGIIYRDSILDKNGKKVDSILTIINPGKSLGYVTFEPFKNKENLKPGKYTLTYRAFSTVKSKQEQYEVDNTITIPFIINDSIYSPTVLENWNSYKLKDSVRDANGKPVVPVQKIYDTIRYVNQPLFTAFFQPSAAFTSYGQCLVFRDANASRIKGTGMTFVPWMYDATTQKEVSLKDEPFKISVYEWANEFKGFSDTANFKFTNLIPLVDGQIHISKSTSSWAYENVKFDDQILFENNKRYLVCVQSSNKNVRFGFDTLTGSLSPRTVFYDQPLNMTIRDGSYKSSGFGLDKIPTIALNVKVIEKSNYLNEIENVKNNVIVYPNPANDFVNIAYKSTTAGQPVEVSVTDITGKVVYFTKVVNSSIGTNVFGFDTEAFTNGIYVVKVSSNEGNSTRKLSIQK